MKRDEIRSALDWYKRAVEAYDQLARRLAAASDSSTEPNGHQDQLREALHVLLPVVGECIAELPGLAAALTEEREESARLRRRAGEADAVLEPDDDENE